jgi:hypothetical protein
VRQALPHYPANPMLARLSRAWSSTLPKDPNPNGLFDLTRDLA